MSRHRDPILEHNHDIQGRPPSLANREYVRSKASPRHNDEFFDRVGRRPQRFHDDGFDDPPPSSSTDLTLTDDDDGDDGRNIPLRWTSRQHSPSVTRTSNVSYRLARSPERHRPPILLRRQSSLDSYDFRRYPPFLDHREDALGPPARRRSDFCPTGPEETVAMPPRQGPRVNGPVRHHRRSRSTERYDDIYILEPPPPSDPDHYRHPIRAPSPPEIAPFRFRRRHRDGSPNGMATTESIRSRRSRSSSSSSSSLSSSSSSSASKSSKSSRTSRSSNKELVRKKKNEKMKKKKKKEKKRTKPKDASRLPKRGKTRIPVRLVSKRALFELGYAFTEEGDTIVVSQALGTEHIDKLLRLSSEYKMSDLEIAAARSSAGKCDEDTTMFRPTTSCVPSVAPVCPVTPPHLEITDRVVYHDPGPNSSRTTTTGTSYSTLTGSTPSLTTGTCSSESTVVPRFRRHRHHHSDALVLRARSRSRSRSRSWSRPPSRSFSRPRSLSCCSSTTASSVRPGALELVNHHHHHDGQHYEVDHELEHEHYIVHETENRPRHKHRPHRQRHKRHKHRRCSHGSEGSVDVYEERVEKVEDKYRGPWVEVDRKGRLVLKMKRR